MRNKLIPKKKLPRGLREALELLADNAEAMLYRRKLWGMAALVYFKTELVAELRISKSMTGEDGDAIITELLEMVEEHPGWKEESYQYQEPTMDLDLNVIGSIYCLDEEEGLIFACEPLGEVVPGTIKAEMRKELEEAENRFCSGCGVGSSLSEDEQSAEIDVAVYHVPDCPREECPACHQKLLTCDCCLSMGCPGEGWEKRGDSWVPTDAIRIPFTPRLKIEEKKTTRSQEEPSDMEEAPKNVQ